MNVNFLKYTLIGLMLVIGSNAFASDIIFLKNGNTVIGDIVSKTELKVIIKTDNGNTYEYPLIEVERISDTELETMPSDNTEYKISSYKDYGELSTGFWFSAEIGEALSCNISRSNYTFTELDITAGYRFSQYFRCGIGVGARYYNNNSQRFSNIAWGMPIYATLRGNLIPSEYRSVIPYYSFDIGASIRDGFMVRPGIGMRVGQNRSAFLVNLSYLGQNIISIENSQRKNKFTSFVMLKVGYEF